jgi:opioid growth factor receptor-like protein
MAGSRIVDFYAGAAPDHRGRSLAQLQSQSLSALESNHDYIQWLFPLPERSSASAHAPILTPADIEAFAQSPALRSSLLDSLSVMLKFYGFESVDTGSRLEFRRGPDFAARSEVWLTAFNHNYLRLTRILRALNLLGCARHADTLFRALQDVYREHADAISEETFEYWQRAARR